MKAFAVGIAALSSCVAGAAIAQSADTSRYPTCPIRIVVPFGPGGPADVLGRPAAQKMSEGLGQQVEIENRGGANGVVGAELVARSAPDELISTYII